MQKFFFAALIALSATIANAAVMSISAEQVTGANIPAGFVPNDLNITFDGQLATQQIRVVLTQGSIYQNANGGNTAPSTAFVGFVPALAYDTFITMGAPLNDAPEARETVTVGGAVNLGGAAATTFSTSSININYAPALGVVIPQGTDYQIARLTFSDDAEGEVWVYSQTLGSEALVASPTGNFPVGQISGGVLSFGPVIPEPTTCVLAGLALVGAAVRRRV